MGLILGRDKPISTSGYLFAGNQREVPCKKPPSASHEVQQGTYVTFLIDALHALSGASSLYK